MENGQPTRVDSIMLAALAQSDYPTYLIEDLVSSGGMDDVYRKMAEVRAYKPNGMTVEDITHVVRQVLDERAQAGLKVAAPQKADEDEVGGAKSTGGFFPVKGGTDSFPPPIVNVAPQPLPGKDFEEVTSLDVPGIRKNVSLLRAEMLLRRWREGKATSSDTLSDLKTLICEETPAPRAH